ncbi:MAG: SAM-dependent DNA methyltransferase [Bacteroidetes bacterium]|nr:MAG: SAM-dependent DNA methyltransferase [Bacteroidota bacterium]
MTNLIHTLFNFLYQTETTKFAFQQWKTDFTAIHGFLDSQRKLDVSGLCATYQIDCNNKESIFELVFCLETYYTIVLRLLAFKVVFKDKKVSKDVFEKDYFLQKGIQNYTCKAYFNWFLAIENIENLLNEIEISTYLENSETDFIKEIFETVFPSPMRHAMGEFYTPDWLANFTIQTLTENDELAHQKTFLDPTCGSGTFIFNVIKKFQQSSDDQIFKQVFGIDLNPISVLAAKTNYLILYAQCFEFSENILLEIPIFYADAIQAKFENNNMFSDFVSEYENITIPKVDYLVGNPPWVNWEYLPTDYKLRTAHLWQHYNLFAVKGLEAGFIKEDISVLLTYIALDKYLKDEGKLGFVVKETLFKSIKQGEGFRKFKIFPTNISLNPYRVDDLTLFKPFKDVVNRTALLFIQKGEAVQYPTDYILWQPLNGKRTFENNFDLKDLAKHFEFVAKKAQPSDAQKTNSGWITVENENLDKTNLILGKSAYLARTGTFTGGANGIFWLNIVEKNNDFVTVQNITERAKNKMKTIKTDLETEFIFPFLTGNDLEFWQYSYSKYTLCPHTAESKMYPIDLKTLEKYPKTLAYFEDFKTELQDRKGFTTFDKHIQLANYYAIQRIGDYTFAPYKVAWRYICKDFRPAVIEYADDKYVGKKNIIPNEKIIFVGLHNRQEAYYLCGLLSSTLYRKTIENYMIGTQITPSIISRLNLPKFDKSNEFHLKISELCENGHFVEEKEVFVNKIDVIVENMLIQITHKPTPSPPQSLAPVE